MATMTTKRLTNKVISKIISTDKWSTHLQRLISVFVDPENTYLYTVAVDKNGVPTVRKLTIARDPQHAREQYKAAQKLIGQYVIFSVRQGWNGDVWFNEIRTATAAV